jgi:alpha-tubulin suppressor-like RCC1 family protein
VIGLPDVVKLAAGGLGTCVVDVAARLWCWGHSVFSSPSTDPAAFDRPTLIEGLTNVIDVDLWSSRFPDPWDRSVGAVAVASGEVEGANASYASRRMVFLRPDAARAVAWPRHEALGRICAIDDGGIACNELPSTGYSFTEMFDYPMASVSDADAGTDAMCVLAADGEVYCMGENYRGVLGLVDPEEGNTRAPYNPVAGLPAAIQVATQHQHACALTTRRTVYCWGHSLDGAMGDEEPAVHRTPVRVAGLPPIRRVTTGARHTCALDLEGAVWCWGWNGQGQLGRGTQLRLDAPVDVELRPRASEP